MPSQPSLSPMPTMPTPPARATGDAARGGRTARVARRALPVVAALALVVGSALPASAHVRVTAIDATQGGFAELAFRVPTESDTASTTKVAVFLPTDTPLAFVQIKPHPGWTHQVTRTTLDTPIEAFGTEITEVISQVTWTADSKAAAVQPGEYDVFDVFAGPLPTADEIDFKAIQTYSDGTVVRWIEPTPAGGEEPEHPAPTLALLPAEDASDEGSGSASPSDSSSASAGVEADTPSVDAASVSSDDGSGDSSLPLIVSIVALIAALAAGGLALGGRRSRG